MKHSMVEVLHLDQRPQECDQKVIPEPALKDLGFQAVVPSATIQEGLAVGCGNCVADAGGSILSTEKDRSPMKILVTGGAGYIGSFMVRQLLDSGHRVVVADSLERGHKGAVDPRATLHIGDLKKREFIREVLEGVDVVIHFAGYIAVGESMQNPGMYFENNTGVALALLEEMQTVGVNKIIFSSTAAVYGNPTKVPIPEDHSKEPTNPYGQSKLMTEQMLHWFEEIHGVRFVALRYFNASGAALDGSLGEAHDPETHIVPNAINAALKGSGFKLFGDDYKTPDGTCVRDYIHVLDLVKAHELAMNKLERQQGGAVYNVGTGKGYSNKDVLQAVREISGRDFPVSVEARRFGDADVLVADPSAIKKDLGFFPQYSDLNTIIKSAWAWHSKKHQK